MPKPLLDDHTLHISLHQLDRLSVAKFEGLYIAELTNHQHQTICKIGTTHNHIQRLRNLQKQLRVSSIATLGAIAVIPVLYCGNRDADQYFLNETDLVKHKVRSLDVVKGWGKFTGSRECVRLGLNEVMAIIREC